jgi:hypothetical protein
MVTEQPPRAVRVDPSGTLDLRRTYRNRLDVRRRVAVIRNRLLTHNQYTTYNARNQNEQE